MSKLGKYLTLILGTLVVFVPPYILLVTAFKTKEEFASTLPYALPESFLNFSNFKLVFEKGHILQGFAVIAYIIVLTILGNIILGTAAGYALARFNFKLKPFILGAYALSIIIPGVTTQVATFGIIKGLGLFNTPYAMVLLYLGTDFIQISIFMQFIKNIPYELDEAAIVEGASLFKVYRSIVFPLLKPAVATVVILKVIAIYNDVYSPYLYMPSQKYPVISTALMRFTSNIAVDWSSVSAAIIIIMIPTVSLYLFMQKYIFSAITSGAVKG